MPGTFVLRPIEANLIHNTDLITKMNPYCSFILGNEKVNSQICKKGGKHPVWNDTITLPANTTSNLIVEIMDKDKLTKDDVVGGCSINLSELQGKNHIRNWYPLFYKNKPAGEILLEASFEGGNMMGNTMGNTMGTNMAAMNSTNVDSEMLMRNQRMEEERLLTNKAGFAKENVIIENQAPTKIFTEQHQVVEPHTFTKNVEVVETVPVTKEIEVTEPHKVLKDIEYTQAVPVKKLIEVVEPEVVTKTVETVEPKLVTKTIQVVENVSVKKQIEVVEMKHVTKEVETMEPQTFHKQVEVTEQVPVMKTVTVSEPVTVSKAVEFVEPVITTQTITKEIHEPVVVDQKITTEVGHATLVGVEQETAFLKEQKMSHHHTKLGQTEQRLHETRADKKLL